MSNEVTPFRIEVPEAELADLRTRLRQTRWPEPEPVADWSQGVPLAWLQDLCRYWAQDYDWRRAEARLNALPLARTELDVRPRQSVGNVAVKRAQEERVLVAEGGIKTAARKLGRTQQIRKRGAVIAARPKHIHGALDSSIDVETARPATRQRHRGLRLHGGIFRPIGPEL